MNTLKIQRFYLLEHNLCNKATTFMYTNFLLAENFQGLNPFVYVAS